ncbi:MAG: hypothetical protein U0X39_13795 [Bacteroidales bacterium]
MKQKLYILGLLTAILMVGGAISKMNHWPGAGILITLGIVIFVFLFLPLALANNYRMQEKRQGLLLYFITWLTCAVVFSAMLFKLMHWPFSGIMMFIAIPFPFVVFMPVFVGHIAGKSWISINEVVFVFFLLVIQSVFAAFLAINVSKTRINDTYALAGNYRVTSMVLDQKTNPDNKAPLVSRIDEIISIIESYEQVILKTEGVSTGDWNKKPGNLLRPDAAIINGIGNESPGEPAGKKLYNGLRGLVDELGKSASFSDLAVNAPVIFDLPASEDLEDWSKRVFSNSNNIWSLAWLDGLKSTLLTIRYPVSR